MPKNKSYFVYLEGWFPRYEKFHINELLKDIKEPTPETRLWSARISTGLMGLTNCEAGNRGPKDYNEVLLAQGNHGLRKLVSLGFITCPVCRPDKVDRFWDIVKDPVKEKYGIESLEDFINKENLPFDSRRLDWKEILSVTGKPPGRIYLPKGLEENELADFKKRFDALGISLPPVGYYNPDVPERFTEYAVPS